MFERLFTLVCVVITMMIFQASAHGQSVRSLDLSQDSPILKIPQASPQIQES